MKNIKIKISDRYYIIFKDDKEIIKISKILNTLDNVIKALGANKDEVEVIGNDR